MMTHGIFGIPESEYEYEFMVLTERPDGNFEWHSNHEDADTAIKTAKEVGGILSHDVRIAHKRRKKTKEQAIFERCANWVWEDPHDDILWYLQEHQDELDCWAECFKKAFCEMVDKVAMELKMDE